MSAEQERRIIQWPPCLSYRSALSTLLDRSGFAESCQFLLRQAEVVEVDFRVVLSDPRGQAAQLDEGGARLHSRPRIGDRGGEVGVCYLPEVATGLQLAIPHDIPGGGDGKEEDASLHRPFK